MRSTKLLVGLVAGVLLLVLLSNYAPAQDPAAVNAKTVSVKLDNDRVRVLESVLGPGEREQLHSHPANVLYVIKGGKIRNHTADGKATEADLKPGQVFYRDPITHWAENIGTTTVHVVIGEFKKSR